MDDKLKRSRLAEIAGWYGMVAIVGAYFLVSFNILPAGGGAYQLLNLTGAAGIIAISVVKKVRQSIVLNLFWAVIAVATLLKLMLHIK
jgi:hypothetical protein